jgi:hypothetical protein
METMPEERGLTGPHINPFVSTTVQELPQKDKKVSQQWHTQKLFFLAGLPELHRIPARMHRCEDTRAGTVSLPLADLVHVSPVMGVA